MSVQFESILLQVDRMIKVNLGLKPAMLAYILSARDLNLLGRILIGIYATCTHRRWTHWEILSAICLTLFPLCYSIIK